WPRGFDVVVVGVEDEGDIVGTGTTSLRPKARRPVVAATVGKSCRMESVDGCLIRRRKGKMHRRGARSMGREPVTRDTFPVARHEHEAALAGDHKDGCIELGSILDPFDAERLEACREEWEAHLRVANEEAYVVEHDVEPSACVGRAWQWSSCSPLY